MTRWGLSMGVSPREPLRNVQEITSDADTRGFDAIWFIDFQLGMKDVYAAMYLAALASSGLHVGAAVTNLVTRHPTVTANATTALDELTDGRAMLGLGAGWSSVYGAGGAPSKLGDLRRGIDEFRQLFSGKEAELYGTQVQLMTARRQIPIYLAVSQPGMLRLAGEKADGAILMGAADADVCNWQLRYLYEGLERAGRSRDEVTVDLMVTMSVDEDDGRALDDVRAWATSQAATMDAWKHLPPAWERFRPQFGEAARSYHLVDHLSLHAGHKEVVSDEFVRTVAIAGGLGECVKRLQRLAALDVDRITFALLSGGRKRRLAQIADEVVPAISALPAPSAQTSWTRGPDAEVTKVNDMSEISERKVAVVTAGAGVGIGAAVVRRLASDGFTVAITDSHERRCREHAEKLSQDLGRPFMAYACDVTDPGQVRQAMKGIVERFGRLDVLVNNAGWSKVEPVAEMSLETWRHCIDVDLTGTFYGMRFALPFMIERGSGNIVNVSSIAAWEMTAEHGAAYAAAKAGVLALTRVAAAENGRYGIRVNAVAPGLIFHEFLRRIYPDDFFNGYAEERSLVGRVGTPDDVAGLVSFLVSDQASYITGEVYGISGGVSPHA